MATDPKIVKQLSEDLENLNDIIDDIAVSLQGKLNSSLIDTKDNLEELTKEFSKGKDITKELESNIKRLDKESGKLSLNRKSAEAQLKKLIEESNKGYVKGFNKKKEILQQQLNEIEAQLKLNEAEGAYLQQLKEENDRKQKINKITNGALKGLSSALDSIGLGTLFTFKSILDSVFKVDNQITQMGKSLGISKDAAGALRKEMQSYSDASNDSFVTVERLVKAQEGLTEQLGIAVDFGNEERETFARLTEITGLSADEAGKLATFSAATGKSTRSYVSDLRVAGMEASRANKIHISDKELLSSISKLSTGILVKFQGNPKALAAAVVEAKKLGANLEIVNKIGDSLLDWESSIENELEAELITGRKINLERAREAALTGDQLDLTRAISEEVGSLADYQEMNVIAQTSLAKAFGLSRDEMSEMLMKQEAINKYGEKAADLNAEQLDYMERHKLTAEQMVEKVENQRSTQEKFNDLIVKLEEKIASLAAGPLGTLMNMFANMASSGVGLYSVLTAIAALSLGRTIASMAALAVQQGLAAAGALTWAAGITLGIGMIAVLAALASGMGAFGSAKEEGKQMKDGVMAPSGKILYSGAEGAIKLSDKDTVIAGTNLGGGGINRNNNSGGGNNNSALIAAIDSLHSTMKTKSNDIYMDGEKVGTQVGRQSSTGTQQSMNSYRLA